MIDPNNLEEFADAQRYDVEDDSDTGLDFYTSLARETGGPVLEIACGTGRISIPIARLGYEVTGLDIVPGMLEMARSKSAGQPIRWVEGDARTFDLGEKFRLIFLTGNAFQAFLTNADQQALLERVHAHLHDDGLFAFETRNPRWRTRGDIGHSSAGEGLFAFLETRTEEEHLRAYTDHEGRKVRISNTQEYNPIAQVLRWTTYRRREGEGCVEEMPVTHIAVRYTFPQDLGALLHYNGFSIVRQYGDWNLEPLSGDSPSIIVVCRKGA